MISNYALAAAGFINILPTIGVFGPKQLQKLYGIPFNDTNLVILMRHRAVLFGLTGAFMFTAAFWRPEWKGLAYATGLTSMLSFVALSSKNNYNVEIRRVVFIDLVASAAMIAALVIESL